MGAFAQSDKLYDFDFEQSKLTDVLKSVHLKHNLNFSYNVSETNKIKVSFTRKSCSVETFLETVFEKSKLTFKKVGTTYVITSNIQGEPVLNGHVSGIISDAKTGERLPFATIAEAHSSMGTLSNKDGYFVINKFVPDTSTLVVSYLGFKPVKIKKSDLTFDKLINIQLEPDVEVLDEVFIESSSSKTMELMEVSKFSLNPNKVNALPSLGEKDLMRAIQYFPGISATDETSAGMVIRGASSDQNLIMFDGFTLYHVDHFYGIFSAFNSEAVKSVNISKGGFEPKVGGRVSGVIDIIGKSGSDKKTSLAINGNLLSANFLLETPLSDKLTFLFAGRRAYTDIIQSSLFTELFNKVVVSTAKNGLFDDAVSETLEPSFYYYDINSKVTYKPNKNNVVSISYYTGEDKLSFQGIQGFEAFDYKTSENTNWGNDGISLKWGRYWNDKVYSNVTTAYSQYGSSINYSYEFKLIEELGGDKFEYLGSQINKVQDWSLKMDNEIYLTGNSQLDIGLSYNKNLIDLESTFDDNLYQEYHERGSLLSFYAQHKVQPTEKLTMTYGARLNKYDKVDTLFLEPRLNVGYKVSEGINTKFSAGMFSQTINRAIRGEIYSSTPDFWVLADGKQIPIISSYHLIGGATFTKKEYTLDIEGYYKHNDGILEYVPRLTNFEPGNIVSPELYFQGVNESYGVDVLLHRQKGIHTGWISYSYLKSFNQFDELNKGIAFPSPQDQRHEVNVINLFKVKRFDLSVSWVFGSGKAYTEPYSEYTVTLLDGTKKKEVILGQINSSRLPVYHRLDLSAVYNFNIGKAKANFGLTIFNAYNRENIKYRKISRVDFNKNTYYLLESPLYLTSDVTLLGFTPNITFGIRL